MKVLVRLDATVQIGTGHFMRCLTLAEGLVRQGAEVTFASRSLPEFSTAMLAALGMATVALPAVSTPAGRNLAHAHWLGCSQEEDARAVIEARPGIVWDWLVVDHYGLDRTWETAMRAVARRIMVIDDLADRHHDCELLLDQNHYPDLETRYDGKVPPDCRLLLGPRFALLRREFQELRQRVGPRQGPVRRLLVFMGGVDGGNFTGRVIEALAGLDVQVEVVIGAQHPARAAIERECRERNHVCHVQTERMAELMAAADLAVGGGGSASWERCCLGLPCVLVALAENQVNIAKSLAPLGAGVYLGTADEADVGRLRRAVLELVADVERFQRLSAQACDLVDGLGVERVCRLMEG